MAKIYTKTGDEGKTSLLGGERVLKSSLRLESYGTIDELNSYLGYLCTLLEEPEDVEFIQSVQSQLFHLGSLLASYKNEREQFGLAPTDPKVTQVLEKKIDEMEAKLDPLKNFILPGGHSSSSMAHVCRAICRRAERSMIRLCDEEGEDFAEEIKYVNRLSDFFFVFARFLNKKTGHPDVIWNS